MFSATITVFFFGVVFFLHKLMQYLVTTWLPRSPAVNVSSRRNSEVFSHRRRAVLTAENGDNRSHVCSCGVATCWFLFGASRLRVNKDAVAAARDALLRFSTAPPNLSHSSLNACWIPPPHPHPLSSVCSLSTEFREQCWSASPSRTPSAFTAFTHFAGGECCWYRDSDLSDSSIFKLIDL